MEPQFLTDQPRTCRIFMLCCIRSTYFLANLGSGLVRNRNRFHLISRSNSEINGVCSNKWTLY